MKVKPINLSSRMLVIDLFLSRFKEDKNLFLLLRQKLAIQLKF